MKAPTLARYWVHNGFLSMAGGEKMSKSLGNVVTVGELLDEGHKGETLRLALLSAYYRQPLEWSPQLVAQSRATLDRLYRSLMAPASAGQGDPASVVEALADDLNTPLALARLAELAKLGDVEATKQAGALLGLLQQDPVEWFQGGGAAASERVDPRLREEAGSFLDAAEIQLRIDRRVDAKKARDYAEADRIRADLAAQGVLLEDGPQRHDLAPRLTPLPARREGPGGGCVFADSLPAEAHPPLTPPCIQGGEHSICPPCPPPSTIATSCASPPRSPISAGSTDPRRASRRARRSAAAGSSSTSVSTARAG